jgi:hypothetical protein
VVEDNLRRCLEVVKLQPVSGIVNVPIVPGGRVEDDTVADELPLSGDDDDVAAGGKGVVDGSRPFCIAWPMNPPTSPASRAMNNPIKARIHHRFHPLLAVAGAGRVSAMGWKYSFDDGAGYDGVCSSTEYMYECC